MEVRCTRPHCSRPQNFFADLDDAATLRTIQQKFCTSCGMPLLLAGRYLPIRLLGQGGFGAAFLARDRYTPAMRPCVVKQFQPSGDLSPNQLQVAQSLFEREAEVLEKLGNAHPQIPDLLAFFELDAPSQVPGKANSFFYLVQEFIDGENLEDEVNRRGPFSEADVLEVLTSILKVLQFVHSHDSIHRDIKPSNIMRRRDGRLFLLDFGAVKQITASAGSPSGKASTGIYSMGFAPPEQMRGDVVYPATDLYALGVTCLMLLTAKDPSELYDAYSNTWKWQSLVTVSDRLQQVLEKMLQPTPSQRFQSTREVLEALQSITASPPPPPSPPPGPSGGAAAAVAPTPATSLQGAPPTPVSSQTQPPAPVVATPVPHPGPAPLSLMEFLASSAFTGFEGGLLAIALASLLGTTLISPVFWIPWLGLVLGLIYAQSRRWIEGKDLWILAGLTLLLVLFVPFLNSLVVSNPLQVIPILAILTGLVAVVVGILFRLIYLLISRVL